MTSCVLSWYQPTGLLWLAERKLIGIPNSCLTGRSTVKGTWHGVCAGAYWVWWRCPRRCRRRSSAVAGRRADWPWRRGAASLYGHDSGAAWAVRDHGTSGSAQSAMWPLLAFEDTGRCGGGKCGGCASWAHASWCGGDSSNSDPPWLGAAVAEWASVLCGCDTVASLWGPAHAEPAKRRWACVLRGASK